MNSKKEPIRLIDAGVVSALRSQTIYHALAYTKGVDTPDTIVLAVPEEPYVCIGFHRDAEQEVNVHYCNEKALPIIRRETGGGTVFIDHNQLFVQWIFSPDNLPAKPDERFRLFLQPQIETYQFFGIKAKFFPPNDVHVRNKKIVGTGAAAIGNAEVVTGNFLLDFDTEAMEKVLKAPHEAFQALFSEGLRKYMTSMRHELSEVPDLEQLKRTYLENCASTLGRKIEVGQLSETEEEKMEELAIGFSTREWLYHFKSKVKKPPLVKIHANVWLYHSELETEGGKIDLAIRTKGKRIDQVSVGGDISMEPHRLKGLEQVLRNVDVNEESLTEVLESFYALHKVQTPGIRVTDWVAAILKMKESSPVLPFS